MCEAETRKKRKVEIRVECEVGGKEGGGGEEGGKKRKRKMKMYNCSFFFVFDVDVDILNGRTNKKQRKKKEIEGKIIKLFFFLNSFSPKTLCPGLYSFVFEKSVYFVIFHIFFAPITHNFFFLFFPKLKIFSFLAEGKNAFN